MEYPSQDSLVSGSLSNSILKNTPNIGTSGWAILSKFGSYQGSSDVSLFSSSLPVLPHEKFIMDSGIEVHSIDDISSNLDELHIDVEAKDLVEELDLSGIGNLLPDEDELFDGIMSDYNQCGLPSLEQVEDFDLFSSGGGIELDTDPLENATLGMAKVNIADGYVGNGNIQYSIPNVVGSIAGEHPYGEHPSRTLFVRNINSNVEDSELRSLFEQYGDIRSMYTHCKHRGFVMISYYDIRHARNAMRALQSKPLRRRKLDIHFSIPKDNPSDKDVNQGTLVVFNLDPSVLNDDLRQIFGEFGEVKEIRETPHKKHHKFVEFYDVRAAEDALRSLNRSDIAGKRIKLEPSRPGGARRNLMQQLSQDLDNDETKNYRHQVGSPLTNSPPGAWVQFSNPPDNGSLRAISHSPTLGCGSPIAIGHSSELTSVFPPLVSNSAKIAPIGHSSELTSVFPPLLSNSAKIAPIGKEHRISRAEPLFSNKSPMHNIPFLHSHSVPERGGGIMPSLSSSSGGMTSFGPTTTSTSAMGTLTGAQFLWGSPNPRTEYNQSSAWPISSSGHAFTSEGQRHGFPYLSNHASFLASSRHHVGSAPSGIPFERHHGFLNDLPEPSFANPISFGNMGVGQTEGGIMVNSGILRGPINPASSLSGYMSVNASPSLRMMPSQRMGNFFIGNPPYAGYGSNSMEGFNERGRIRRPDNSGSHLDSKKQFQLDLDKIISGEDTRTTLMIKNIPNKYTSKMILAAIDENHKGTYDFLYLPIDFKNKCNVGYAFINMVSPSHIISFYQAFNGKRWEKFNSEKVASLAYARIQGKAALVAHFQNSSLMNEEKRCRPLLFDSEGVVETSDQEPFLANGINICVQQEEGTFLGDLLPESLISKAQEEKADSGIAEG